MSESEVKVYVDLSSWKPGKFPRVLRLLYILKGLYNYLISVSDAVSRLLNVMIGGNGADTLSSQAFRTPGPFWELLRKWLDIIFSPRTRNHCQKMHWRCLERSKKLLAGR